MHYNHLRYNRQRQEYDISIAVSRSRPLHLPVIRPGLHAEMKNKSSRCSLLCYWNYSWDWL